jgi:antitoxin (DNA-binding transcriptional repressor) of toxin-antitoxin stability system
MSLSRGRYFNRTAMVKYDNHILQYAAGREAMTKTITATEAVRKFSEILNSIKYAGNDYTVMRGGKPVATIHAKALTLGDLAGLVKSLPALGDEAERFKKDLKETRKRQPHMPEKVKWA